MKITSIRTTSWLGARDVHLNTQAPINLICGGNGQGKSSIRDAVLLALCAEVSRVRRVGDYPMLITEGYQSALAEVTADGVTRTAGISKAGKLTHSHKSKDVDPRLQFVLDAQRIGGLDLDGRRKFMFDLLGVTLDHAAIAARMKRAGLDAAKVAEVSNFLRVGFDAALAEAKRKTSDARAAWKAITGENYGEKKAQGWAAPAPQYSDEAIAELQVAQEDATAALAAANTENGSLVATHGIVGDAREAMGPLRATAELLARRRDKLAADKAGLEAAIKELQDAEVAAAALPKAGLIHDLARSLDFCLRELEDVVDADLDKAQERLEAYEAEFGPLSADGTADPEAAARLPALREAHDLMARAVLNSTRDMQASEAATAELVRLQALVDGNPVDDEALAAARDAIASASEVRTAADEALRAAQQDKAAALAAAEKTATAAKHHAEAAAWGAIADKLEPDGIQTEILAEHLKPINDRLAQAAVDTGWPVVFVRHDMTITAAGRVYELLSKSERWRCDAMLAEAAAHLSGLRVLMLDEMDLLEPAARPQLLGWLDVLAANNEVDTALVFATLKSPPGNLTENIAVHWTQAGRCGELQDEAVAA